MGIIKVLPDIVANKIAAGEVVERPASIVKELMENALDAGAGSITVWAGYGGKGLIRVRDDGCGMDGEDARACLLRHATSKIADAGDIQGIATLGFRGEALPSIASVSRFTLTTRRACDDAATMVKAEGGVIESAGPCAAEPGTTVEVADLFFNTPARRKFLKSDAAEYAAIAEVFSTISLSRCGTAFCLRRNNEPAAQYPACADLRDRIAQIYPPEVSGRLYPVALEKTDFRLAGFVAAPDTTRVNRTGQKFFINGRPVQSAGLSMALSRAYGEFLPRGRFPVAFLFLDIDQGFVDVNVHPAKREVRLRTESYFQDLVVQAVRQVLHGRGLFYDEPSCAIAPQSSPGPAGAERSTLREAAAGWQAPPPPGPATARGTPPCVSGPAPDRQPAAMRLEQAISRQSADTGLFSAARVTGQVLGMYIIAENNGELMVLDQHAAHERIVYEELLAALSQNADASQTMMFPATLHLSLPEGQALEEALGYFRRLGFGINPLGGSSFSIDGVPACVTDTDPARLIRDSIHELMGGSPSKAFESRLQELAAILACKTHAVKAGTALTVPEMQHLLERLGRAENPHICPHGRPTFFIMTRRELDRRFQRT